MKTAFRRPAVRSFLPGSGKSAVWQLIIATGVCFVAFFFTAVCFQAFAHYRYEAAVATLLPYVALPPAGGFWSKAWTLLTYGFFHAQFWGWVSNAIWMYCWGGVLQMLTGDRQVIPVFVYGTLVGGMCCLLAQLVPGAAVAPYVIGSQAGVMALAAAAFTLAPDFRFWLGPSLSVSIKWVAGAFAVLALVSVGAHLPGVLWLAGGALTGFGYVRLLRAGYRPGEWVYDLLDGASRRMTPRERKPASVRRGSVLQRQDAPKTTSGTVQGRVDALLEKIHRNGYDALTREEKDFLTRASQGND